MSNVPPPAPRNLLKIGIPLALLVVLAAVGVYNRDELMKAWNEHKKGSSDANAQQEKRPLFELVRDKPETLRLVSGDLASLKINLHTIESTPPPYKLRLQGTVTFDPNRYVRVHSRFPGEVRKVGISTGTNRPIRYGDKVTLGQLLLTIWSKDVGEKKSELVDALSKVHFDKLVLDRLVKSGVVAERAITDAERNYQGDIVAVSKAERTLRSWNFTETEIEEVRQEAKDIIALADKLRHPEQRPESSKEMVQAIIAEDAKWAELDIVAAQEGVIAQKNFNVGDIIDTTQDLMMIADIDQLQVLVNAFEEDLPVLRQLAPDEQKWSLQIMSEAINTTISGRFDQIGIMVDPKMHISPVMGYVDNTQRHLSIGQFVTATIEIPGDRTQVVIPVSAAVEEGSTTAVFVETNVERHEYTRRRIAVARRGRTQMHVMIEPDKLQAERGAQPLHSGERILTNSVVLLDSELSDLTSSSPQR